MDKPVDEKDNSVDCDDNFIKVLEEEMDVGPKKSCQDRQDFVDYYERKVFSSSGVPEHLLKCRNNQNNSGLSGVVDSKYFQKDDVCKHCKSKKVGRLEVITGPMFAGKTEELLRRVTRSIYANQNIRVFKHQIDDRYGEEGEVQSHNGNCIYSYLISNSEELKSKVSSDFDVVAIDEVQFFDDNITEVILDLVEKGVEVIVSGLDMNYKGEPFGCMPELMSIADQVDKLTAICERCGREAVISERVVDESDEVLVGEKDCYKPVCRGCYLSNIKKGEV